MAAVTLAVYWRALGNGFVILDDLACVIENDNVRQGLNIRSLRWAFTTFAFSNWHPLTWLSHMVDYRLFGADPRGHHLVSILLHVANSLLLFAILKKMTGRGWSSLFAASLFSLHPLHVESVAWVSERKDVLSTLFWMLTLGAYVRYVGWPTLARYGQVLCFFTLGLLSKPMLVSLPLVLLLLDYWPLGRLGACAGGGAGGGAGKVTAAGRRRIVLEKVPLVILGALTAIMTVLAPLKEGYLLSVDAVPLGLRLANAVVAYSAYIRKMFFPINLSAFYPYPESYHWPEVAAAMLLLSGITWWALWSARRAPHFITGWLWYLVTLLPVIGLVQVGDQAMADRYTYIPLIGLFVAISWGLPGTIPPEWRLRIASRSAGAALLLVLALVARRQTGFWEDSVTLFSNSLRVTPGHFLPHYHLAIALEVAGDVRAALSHYRQAVELNPRFADGYNHLGVAYIKSGEYGAARESFRLALEANPDFIPARNNLQKLRLLGEDSQ